MITTPKLRELDLLASSAHDIIHSLLKIIEDQASETYYHDDRIMHADDWLKWYNAEGTDYEMMDICKELTGEDLQIIISCPRCKSYNVEILTLDGMPDAMECNNCKLLFDL